MKTVKTIKTNEQGALVSAADRVGASNLEISTKERYERMLDLYGDFLHDVYSRLGLEKKFEESVKKLRDYININTISYANTSINEYKRLLQYQVDSKRVPEMKVRYRIAFARHEGKMIVVSASKDTYKVNYKVKSTIHLKDESIKLCPRCGLIKPLNTDFKFDIPTRSYSRKCIKCLEAQSNLRNLNKKGDPIWEATKQNLHRYFKTDQHQNSQLIESNNQH